MENDRSLFIINFNFEKQCINIKKSILYLKIYGLNIVLDVKKNVFTLF